MPPGREMRDHLRVLRVGGTVVVVCALTVVVSACGGGASSTAPPTPPSALLAYAHVVNLRTGDVPGFRLPRAASNSGEVRAGAPAAIVRCDDGLLEGDRTIGDSSPSFHGSLEHTINGNRVLSLLPISTVSSAVYVTPSEALTRRALLAASSSAGRACQRRALAEQRGVTVTDESGRAEPLLTDVSVTALPSPLPGAPVYGERAYGLLAFGTIAHQRTGSYSDRFAFAAGPHLVVLETFGDPRPVPAATERRLLALLYARAVAAGRRGS
jgi:hypothetical protein